MASVRRLRPASPMSRSRRAGFVPWRGGATAPSSRGGDFIPGSVPALPGGLTYVEIVAGYQRTVAPERRLPGRVGVGRLRAVQCSSLPLGSPTSRSARAAPHAVARRNDGSRRRLGEQRQGQCRLPGRLPGGLTYVEVAAGIITRWRAGATAPSSHGGRWLWAVQRSRASGLDCLRRGRGRQALGTVARRSDGIYYSVSRRRSCRAPGAPSKWTSRRLHRSFGGRGPWAHGDDDRSGSISVVRIAGRHAGRPVRHGGTAQIDSATE